MGKVFPLILIICTFRTMKKHFEKIYIQLREQDAVIHVFFLVIIHVLKYFYFYLRY